METLNITVRDFIDEPTLSSHDNMDEYRRAGICYITDASCLNVPSWVFGEMSFFKSRANAEEYIE